MSADFPDDMGGHPRQPDDERTLQDLLALQTLKDPTKVVTVAPTEHFRLGYLSVACLVINRIIGTGIFESPQTVMIGTNSPGITLLFWFFGVLWCLAGTHVYLEYGLNVPRYVVDGIEQSIPRNGGDLNYLQYVYSKPRYSKDTVLLMGCLFGISFICIGNMAGNCIICALRLLQAAHPDKGDLDFAPGMVRGFAIGIAVFACFIHSFSRRGGILLNNTLALVKVGILLLIIGTACAVAAGGVRSAATNEPVPNVIGNNTSGSKAFANASGDANGYAEAFLAIIFAFSGFDQPNYVLGEIHRPRTTYPIAAFVGVTTVCILYMAVNISYMVVVPYDQQRTSSVAQQFFDMTFGARGGDAAVSGKRAFNAFLAISSLGNIIVMTFTAARMKQEIAKQGFLPFPKFFAQNQDLSLGRLLRFLKARFGITIPGVDPAQHSEKTPVGAFMLHFLSCFVLIFATYNLSPNAAYNLLSGLIAYLPTAWSGTFLALGILILRFRGPPRTKPVTTGNHPGVPNQQPVRESWAAMTHGTVKPWLSVTAAIVYLIGNLYPIIADWIPPSGKFNETLSWFLVPTISWAILAFGVLWFCGFLVRAKLHKNERFVLERKPEFDYADGGDDGGDSGGVDGGKRRQGGGGLILIHETVTFSWPGTEMNELQRMGANGPTTGVDGLPDARARPPPPANDLAGTDFEPMVAGTSGATYG